MRGSRAFRWRLADDDGGQSALFAEEELLQRQLGMGAYRGLEFLHVRAKRIIGTVPEMSRLPFRHTINAYRGCSHACTYCFARPTHEYLGLGTGEDFDRTLVVKINAVERVRAEVRGRRWNGDVIAMGTNTDPYQRAEGKYRLTRGIVDALAEVGNPFSILTKSTLILRDLDRLVAAAGRAEVRCNFSIATLDPRVWKATEPGTPHPRQRVDAVRRLNEAGIPTGVLIAPIIPGLSDSAEQLEEVTAACLEAGAVSVSPLVLHLRPGVREHFLADLQTKDPALAGQLTRRYRHAYLRAAEQDDIVGPVTRTVVRLRPQAPPSRQWHPSSGPRPHDRSPHDRYPGGRTPAAGSAEQLPFGS
ncbi:MAG TPA: radical SAM protein [Acidimicrobiales bacterium]|nr:radical SAM protein [Acidimicrobiales bacterium]